MKEWKSLFSLKKKILKEGIHLQVSPVKIMTKKDPRRDPCGYFKRYTFISKYLIRGSSRICSTSRMTSWHKCSTSVLSSGKGKRNERNEPKKFTGKLPPNEQGPYDNAENPAYYAFLFTFIKQCPRSNECFTELNAQSRRLTAQA